MWWPRLPLLRPEGGTGVAPSVLGRREGHRVRPEVPSVVEGVVVCCGGVLVGARAVFGEWRAVESVGRKTERIMSKR